MRALQIHRFGGPEELKLEDVELPDPGPGEVQLEVLACAINHLDVDVIEGVSRFPIEFPFIPGYEVIGRVTKVGEGVQGWTGGERVVPKVQRNCGVCSFCLSGNQSICDSPEWVSFATSGGYAEALNVKADSLIPVPDELTDVEAAATTVAFGTAWHMLFTRGELQPAETVLINAVGAGIGSAALQLAKFAGATVIGTAGSDAKLERARDLGMDHGINYTDMPQFSDQVLELTGGRGVDLVYEHLGGSAFQEGFKALRKNGRMVTCGAHAGEVVEFDIIPFFRKQQRLIASFSFVELETRRVLDLAARGVVKPIIDSVFTLEQGQEAMARVKERQVFGKIIFTPNA